MPNAACPAIDLVLLEDLSGSFADDLPVLKAQIPNLIATVEGLAPDTDFGVASFIDKPTLAFGSAGDYVYRTELAVSANNAAVLAAINGLSTRSGNDAPEAQLEALLQVALRSAEVGWRTGATRVVMLSTDAPFHVAGDFASAGPNDLDAVLDGTPPGTGEDYPTIAALRAALLAANIFPVFSVTADQRATYQGLIDQLGFGAIVTLTADSGNFADAVRTALAAACGKITVPGTDLNDTLSGGVGDDGVFGGLGDDSCNGAGGSDTVDGGAGNDSCAGGDGTDQVIGGSGRDTLRGDAGDDTLRGGTGDDSLTGGLGADRFVVNQSDGADTVADFQYGLDRLDLSSFGRDAAGAAVLSAVAVPGGVRLTLPGATVTLIGITLAAFDLSDVLLVDGNAAPTAAPDSASTIGGAPVAIAVLANDADLESDTLTVTDPGAPANGSVALTPAGAIVYTANPGFSGVDSFTYTISDGVSSATGTVTVTVAPVLTGGAGDDVLTGTAAGETMNGPGDAIWSSAAAGATRCWAGRGTTRSTAAPASTRCWGRAAPTASRAEPKPRPMTTWSMAGPAPTRSPAAAAARTTCAARATAT